MAGILCVTEGFGGHCGDIPICEMRGGISVEGTLSTLALTNSSDIWGHRLGDKQSRPNLTVFVPGWWPGSAGWGALCRCS